MHVPSQARCTNAYVAPARPSQIPTIPMILVSPRLSLNSPRGFSPTTGATTDIGFSMKHDILDVKLDFIGRDLSDKTTPPSSFPTPNDQWWCNNWATNMCVSRTVDRALESPGSGCRIELDTSPTPEETSSTTKSANATSRSEIVSVKTTRSRFGSRASLMEESVNEYNIRDDDQCRNHRHESKSDTYTPYISDKSRAQLSRPKIASDEKHTPSALNILNNHLNSSEVITVSRRVHPQARPRRGNSSQLCRLSSMENFTLAYGNDCPKLEAPNSRRNHVRQRVAHHRRHRRQGSADSAATTDSESSASTVEWVRALGLRLDIDHIRDTPAPHEMNSFAWGNASHADYLRHFA